MHQSIILALSIVAGSSAWAQGSCNGMLAGTLSLAVVRDGTLTALPSDSAGFDAAECACGAALPSARDIEARLMLTTALPLGTTGTAEVWVGRGCASYTTRTSGSACEKIADLDISQLTTAATGDVLIPLPAQSLFAPVSHGCAAETHQNDVYLVVYTDPQNPLAGCELDVTESNVAPAAVASAKAAMQDNGLAYVSWVAPPVTASSPAAYQLMCSTATETGSSETLGFSACSDGVLQRRGDVSAYQPGTPWPCSTVLSATATSASVGPITAMTTIQVMAIDSYGNATPSASLVVAPASIVNPPLEPGPSHGCSMSGDDGPRPLALLALLVLAFTMRRLLGISRR